MYDFAKENEMEKENVGNVRSRLVCNGHTRGVVPWYRVREEKYKLVILCGRVNEIFSGVL